MSKPVVIVTRPLADARRLAGQLSQIGLEAVIAPLMTIETLISDGLPHGDVQAVVFTSANGVAGLLAQHDAERFTGYAAVAVGPASAAAARAAGFANVIQSGGDAAALVETVKTRFRPDGGAILYPSGVHLASDLSGELSALGFTVVRPVVYRASHTAQLPDAALRAMAQANCVAVSLYSPRTARIWCGNLADLVKDKPGLPNLMYFCLSDNVARIVRDHAGNGAIVHVAKTADDAGMIELLSTRLGNRG